MVPSKHELHTTAVFFRQYHCLPITLLRSHVLNFKAAKYITKVTSIRSTYWYVQLYSFEVHCWLNFRITLLSLLIVVVDLTRRVNRNPDLHIAAKECTCCVLVRDQYFLFIYIYLSVFCIDCDVIIIANRWNCRNKLFVLHTKFNKITCH